MEEEKLYSIHDVKIWQEQKTKRMIKEAAALEDEYYKYRCRTTGKILKKYQNQTHIEK